MLGNADQGEVDSQSDDSVDSQDYLNRLEEKLDSMKASFGDEAVSKLHLCMELTNSDQLLWSKHLESLSQVGKASKLADAVQKDA